jgi:aminoacrylate hydrolase
MPKAAVAGGEINYEITGEGPTLMLVAGLSGVGRSWTPQVPAFSKRFRVVTYDQRGTGGSDRLQKVFSLDQMARELAGLMDALKIDRAHVVGHSTGGAIGQTLAAEQPGRIDRLVLSSSWTHCDPFFRRLFEARRKMYQTAGPELHVLFHPLWLYPAWWIAAHDDEITAEQTQALAETPSAEISMGRIDALLAFDRRATMGTIRSRTLVVGSRNDYITPAYFSEALAQGIPGAKLILSEDGGHAFGKTRPEEFNRIVLDFLTAP